MHARTLVGTMFTLIAGCGSAVPPRAAPPNLVVILVDDLGWGDVGYHGGSQPTPRIDRLVASGVELDRFYTAPVCSPTRAGMLTGRYPIRFGMQRNVTHPWDAVGLPTEETTLPEVLAEAGYRRRALVGKWHLGYGKASYHPLEHGFTEFYGFYAGAVDYHTHEHLGELDWHRGREPARDEGYATELLADEAVRFLDEVARETSPFLLYLTFSAPHAPYQTPAGDAGGRSPEVYAAVVGSLDHEIGRVLDALAERGLERDTIVWFASDNGANRVGSNAPLRGWKKTVYEGAVRVPAAIAWPGTLAPRRTEERIDYIDVMPTLLGLAGVGTDALAVDGLDLSAVVLGTRSAPPRPLFTWYEDGQSEAGTVHDGPWKLVRTETKRRSRVALELYDVLADPREEHDLAASRPAVTTRLERALAEFAALRTEPAVSLTMMAPEGWRPKPDWRME